MNQSNRVAFCQQLLFFSFSFFFPVYGPLRKSRFDVFLVCCVITLVLSTEKHCSYFFKKGFVSQKIFLKVIVLKTSKFFSDCHMKTCLFLRKMVIFKVPSNGF